MFIGCMVACLRVAPLQGVALYGYPWDWLGPRLIAAKDDGLVRPAAMAPQTLPQKGALEGTLP